MFYMLSASVVLGPVGAQAHNEPSRLQANSKIKDSVVAAGSNNWYHEPMVKKDKPDKKSQTLHHGGGTLMCD
jgi:hypothetical protein